MCSTLKDYKNVCDKNGKQFWGIKVNDLYNVSLTQTCGMYGKAVMILWRTNPQPLNSRKIWQRFYQNLFTKAHKHSVNYDMPVNTAELGEMESSSLSNLTNFKELRKVLKKLKNGEAAGIDRVSNEMIRASFDILKPAYLKLFNLITTVCQVLAIWCKGLITPLDKNRNPVDPDNYRPICALSCLCKFFTILSVLLKEPEALLLIPR